MLVLVNTNVDPCVLQCAKHEHVCAPAAASATKTSENLDPPRSVAQQLFVSSLPDDDALADGSVDGMKTRWRNALVSDCALCCRGGRLAAVVVIWPESVLVGYSTANGDKLAVFSFGFGVSF